jgi:hypothetical protein
MTKTVLAFVVFLIYLFLACAGGWFMLMDGIGWVRGAPVPFEKDIPNFTPGDYRCDECDGMGECTFRVTTWGSYQIWYKEAAVEGCVESGMVTAVGDVLYLRRFSVNDDPPLMYLRKYKLRRDAAGREWSGVEADGKRKIRIWRK